MVVLELVLLRRTARRAGTAESRGDDLAHGDMPLADIFTAVSIGGADGLAGGFVLVSGLRRCRRGEPVQDFLDGERGGFLLRHRPVAG